MKKRISLPFLAAVVVVLIAVIVIVKPFPQKASAVFPEKLLELSPVGDVEQRTQPGDAFRHTRHVPT